MDIEKISEKIKEIRLKNNLSQKEFAVKFGVTYQAVSKWENAKNIPDISIIKEICKEYNISLDEFLDNKSNIDVKKSNKRLFLIIVLIFILIIILLYFIFRNNDFEFKMISSDCNDFTVVGSMAYNKDKTSLSISEVNYCGTKEDTKYKTINCTLFENNDKVKTIIDENTKNDISLNDFLDNVMFHVYNYAQVCKTYNEDSLYLEIETVDYDNNITEYKVPLKLSNTCEKK